MKALCQPSHGTPICSQCNTLIPKGVTRSCSAALVKDPPPRGLGTRIASLISSLGYKKKCIPCQKRAAKLDRLSNWLYFLVIGWWNGFKLKPSKAKRRKQIALSSQENPDRKAAKDARRQALLEQQKLS